MLGSRGQLKLKPRETCLDIRIMEGSVDHVVLKQFLNEQMNRWGVKKSTVEGTPLPLYMTTDRGSSIKKAC